MAVSAWLTYTALVVIKATCDWCLASAAIMALILIVSLLALRSELPERPPQPWPWLAGAFVLALGGFATAVNDMNAKVVGSVSSIKIDKIKVADLLPPPSKMKGDADAKVTIIEFADVNCEACRQIHPTVEQLFDLAGGRMRLGFRHLPLYEKSGHESSLVFAVVADYAATEGKFWDYLATCFDEANQERVKTNDGLLEIAREVGLDSKGVAEAIRGGDSPTVLSDLDLCDRLNIVATPTFIVIAEGQPPRAATASSLADLIQSSPYKELAFPE
jgi:protein-disulfide isomerase